MTKELARPPRATTCASHLLFVGLAIATGCSNRPSPQDSSVGERTDKLICSNSLTTQAFALNALLTNHDTMMDLITHPLNTNSFATVLRLQFSVVDVAVPTVMKYLVRCALGQGQGPVVLNRPAACPPARQYTLRASLGLCPQWETGLPDAACLQRVSACMLALNNAEGKRVSLSILGDPDDPVYGLQPQPAVPTDIHLPLSSPIVTSFSDCSPPQTGELRNCSWSTDYVGTCTPGEVVSIAAGAPPMDSGGVCNGDPIGQVSPGHPAVMRVCQGPNGCDSDDPRHIVSIAPGGCDTFPDAPSGWFQCPPAPSPANPNVADFSVMVAKWDSADTDGFAIPDATSVSAYSFRAAELEVFRYSEGGFFGNLLDPNFIRIPRYVEVDQTTCAVTGSNQIVDAPIYQDAWACGDVNWSNVLGYSLHRICATSSGQNCIAHATSMPCFRTSAADSQCVGIDASGAFRGCHRDGNPTPLFTITTHLNGPCDELRSTDTQFCQRGRGDSFSPRVGQGPTSRSVLSSLASAPTAPSSPFLPDDDPICVDE